MKKWSLLAVTLLAATAFLGADIADAKRLGGGRSFGAQRQATPSQPAPPSAAPATPAAPAQALPGKSAAPQPAASGASRWLGPLAGLAAGLGIAALLSHFGLSEGFASMLLLTALVVGAVFLIRMFLGRRTAPVAATRPAMQYAGNAAATAAGGSLPQIRPSLPEPPATAAGDGRFEPVWGGATAQPAANRFPPGFDPAPFVQQAKLQFKRLQAAYDTGDRRALADVMTPEMFAEISRDLDARGTHEPTEVVALEADVREVVTEGRQYVASVHFSGLLREDGVVLEKPFEELWNLVKPVDGSAGWLLAGIQQLEPAA